MFNNRIFVIPHKDAFPESLDKSPQPPVFAIFETFYSVDGQLLARGTVPKGGYFESIEDLVMEFAMISKDLGRFEKVLDDSMFKAKGKKPKPSGKSFNSAAELFADLNDKPAPHKHFSQKIRESAPQIAAGVFKNKFKKKK